MTKTGALPRIELEEQLPSQSFLVGVSFDRGIMVHIARLIPSFLVMELVEVGGQFTLLWKLVIDGHSGHHVLLQAV